MAGNGSTKCVRFYLLNAATPGELFSPLDVLKYFDDLGTEEVDFSGKDNSSPKPTLAGLDKALGEMHNDPESTVTRVYSGTYRYDPVADSPVLQSKAVIHLDGSEFEVIIRKRTT